jgi:hypothetical protein
MNEHSESQATPNRQSNQLIDVLLELLAQPRQDDFYAQYAKLVHALCRVDALVVVDASNIEAGQAAVLGQTGSSQEVQDLFAQFSFERWQASEAQGYMHDVYRRKDGLGAVLLMVRLIEVDVTKRSSVLLLSLPERDRAHIKEALVRALLVKDLRATVKPDPKSASTAGSVGLLNMLALATEVLHAPQFGAAALSLVNGAVKALGLRQAVLCWRSAADAEVVAISHIDRFETTSRFVKALALAAADVLATDQMIAFSRNINNPDQVPSHHKLLEDQSGMHHVVSLPMRDASGQTQAVLIAFTDKEPLSESAINEALLMLELVYPRLADGRVRDAGFFKRHRIKFLQHLELLVGPGRPWVKLGALFGAVLLLILLFVKVPYRVEATAQLITDSTRIITSQNDGRLLDVFVDVGDSVAEGQALAQLDTTDLRQQESEVLSEIQRYMAEEDKARAAGALAEMQVAGARRAQAEARLRRVVFLRQQARSEAPFAGVVVEGERRNLLGASVKRGDKLFRIAEVRDLYVVLQVPEHAIRELSGATEAELLLLSQPAQPIRLRVSTFVPMAQVKGEEGNQFLLKAQIVDPVASWWRPGMTGLAKIEVGTRNITWVLFHRMIDKLRLWFWW